MHYKIEKGIPLPADLRSKKATSPLTLAMMRMEVGDSMEISKEDSRQVNYIAMRLKIKVSQRQTGEETKRMWRIA